MRLLFQVFLSLLPIQSLFATTLDEAFQAALSKNEVVGQSRERVYQADQQLRQATGSVLPSLLFEATYLRQPELDVPLADEFSPEEQTTANFKLTQPLFRGFREFAGIRQRRNTLSAEQQNRVRTLLELYQSVATSYLTVLSLEQDLKNLQEQKKIYGDRISLLQARIRRGESNSTEALTARSTEAVLEAEMKIVESKLVSARENLRLLTTLPIDSKLVDASMQSRSEFPALKPLKEYLDQIEQRPDVKTARELHEATQEEVRVVRGGHWPTLDLIGNYYVERPEGLLSDLKWDVQLKFVFPIYEGGIVQSRTREASSKSRAQELELNRIRRQAEADITSLYEGLKNRSEQLAALQRASELAEENYQVLQRDFRRGLSKSIDVQLGLTEFRQARRSYDQARFEARLDFIKLQIASAQFPAALAKEL